MPELRSDVAFAWHKLDAGLVHGISGKRKNKIISLAPAHPEKLGSAFLPTNPSSPDFEKNYIFVECKNSAFNNFADEHVLIFPMQKTYI